MSKLWYDKPAEKWNYALPLGNGSLGAMIFGHTFEESIVINEENLWSGAPGRDVHKSNAHLLATARKQLAEGNLEAAEKTIYDIAPGIKSANYLTFGKILLERPDARTKGPFNYRRELDLDTGIFTANYQYPDYILVDYKTECFTSYADDVLVYHYNSGEFDWNAMSVFIQPYLKSTMAIESGDTIVIRGKCPYSVEETDTPCEFYYPEDKESIEFCAKLKILTKNNLQDYSTHLRINRMNDFVMIFAIATSYNGFDKKPMSEGVDAEAECTRKLENALKYTYEELKARHIEAYQKEYFTSKLEFFGLKSKSDLPTDERLKAFKDGDPELVGILHDYARYLLLSSSRCGQPANLQGIWTETVTPPWRSNFTTNINTQMNYWHAEQAGLSNCHMALMRMLKDLSRRGNQLGMRGWCLCHNTDIWRFNTEATKGFFAFWHVGGIWCCRHIYEHFMYTMDTDFLKEYWDVLAGADEFLRDWMTEDKNGYLISSPSASPENCFFADGIIHQACESPAMDLSLISDFYKCLIELCPYIGKNSSEYESIFAKIKPLQISESGRIIEWDKDYEEAIKLHAHISHLCGYFPCNLYGEDSIYFEPMKRSLEGRRPESKIIDAWPNAWRANMYVRMKDKENAYISIVNAMCHTLYKNMLNGPRVFQIDGNFGIACAISEMLVQSHRNGIIELLPCLPDELKDGRAKNIIARGAYKITMEWHNGKLTSLTVLNKDGEDCTEALKASGKLLIH